MADRAQKDVENAEQATEKTPLVSAVHSMRPHLLDTSNNYLGLRITHKAERSEVVPKWVFLIIASLVLIIGGAMTISFIEGWHFLTSLYVIVQIATTIGYGDFTVTTDAMKLFCSFYVLLVLVVLSYTLNLCVKWMHESSMRKMRRYLKRIEARWHSTYGGTRTEQACKMKKVKAEYQKYNELIVASTCALCAIGFGTVFYATYEKCTCSYGRSAVADCKDDTYEQCVATGGYQKTWVGSFYMSVITLTTVGFGDHSPRSYVGRAIGIVWMLVGVFSTAFWLATLTKVFFEEQISCDAGKEMNQELFNKLDKDGNGALSLSEFRAYFLVKNGLVHKEDLDLIDNHFSKLQKNERGKVTFDSVHSHSLDMVDSDSDEAA